MEFAAKAELPKLNNLLIPRTKGFFAITQQLKNRFDAVYSTTLCFNTYVICITLILIGYVRNFAFIRQSYDLC